MEELLQWMEYIEDVRQERKVRHLLKDILVIVLFATLANADDWVEIALFGQIYQNYLRKYIELKNGPPSHDTIRRVMGMISPDILQQLYGKWQELLNREEGKTLKKIICIDGKTMRSNKQGNGKPSHIVSAWSREDGFGIGQKAVDEKSNEITAIPELLEKLQVKGQIITIDAMGTQMAIAEKIREKRADYVLALKGNQGMLYGEVKEYFADEELRKKIESAGNYKKTKEKAHGQIETREYYQTEDIRWMPQKNDWKGLKSIAMERKRIEKNGKKTEEYRYYISSLKGDIETLSRAVRGHWSIESMHWHLDVTFREDANATIDKVSAQNLNIIRKWSLSILKMMELTKKNLSMKKKRFVISLLPIKYLEEVLEF
jgi:predicted transposase YbfD/YdcC